jgi:putative FmdB family regulatory protein
MIYPFKCPSCEYYTEVFRHVSEVSDIEICDKCGTEMVRVYTIPMIEASFFSYYDPGLGRQINSKDDIKRAKADYKRKTGNNLVEIGTDKIESKPRTLSLPELPSGTWDRVITE